MKRSRFVPRGKRPQVMETKDTVTCQINKTKKDPREGFAWFFSTRLFPNDFTVEPTDETTRSSGTSDLDIFIGTHYPPPEIQISNVVTCRPEKSPNSPHR